MVGGIAQDSPPHFHPFPNISHVILSTHDFCHSRE